MLCLKQLCLGMLYLGLLGGGVVQEVVGVELRSPVHHTRRHALGQGRLVREALPGHTDARG